MSSQNDICRDFCWLGVGRVSLYPGVSLAQPDERVSERLAVPHSVLGVGRVAEANGYSFLKKNFASINYYSLL